MGYCGMLAGVRESVPLDLRAGGRGRVLVLENGGEHMSTDITQNKPMSPLSKVQAK